MRIDPRLVADAIADAYDGHMPRHTRRQLALALSRGQGVAFDGQRVYILLRSVWDADDPADPGFRPTLVVTRMPTKQAKRKYRPTTAVATAFLNRVPRPGAKPRHAEHKAPTVSDSSALVPLAGAGAKPADVVRQGKRTISWYDLNLVPVGHLIYEVAADHTVLVYQRVGPDSWFMLQGIPGAQDIVPLPAVLHGAVRGIEGEIDGFESLPGDPILLRQP